MLWLTALLTLLTMLAGGCALAVPSAAQYPAPVPSAVHPGVIGRGDMAYARGGLEAVRKWLREYDPDGVLEEAPSEIIALPEARAEASCALAPGEMPVLVCHFGPSESQPVAQGLFWYDRGGWQAQLYPPAPFQVADRRREAFIELGCQIGCYAGISAARQIADPDGTRLLVVANLGHSGAFKAEEAQVLRLKEGTWAVEWLPEPGDWHYGHTTVTLSPKGAETFQLGSSSWMKEDSFSGFLAEPEAGEHRRFRERWVRKGNGYVMHDRVEEPTSYGALVRVIYYLSRGSDEKAQTLLGSSVDLEDARKTLAQRPLRQGWNVTRWGTDGYLLDRTGRGRPDLGVRFEQRGDDWILAEIWSTDR